jgi:hypothetical protein
MRPSAASPRAKVHAPVSIPPIPEPSSGKTAGSARQATSAITGRDSLLDAMILSKGLHEFWRGFVDPGRQWSTGLRSKCGPRNLCRIADMKLTRDCLGLEATPSGLPRPLKYRSAPGNGVPGRATDRSNSGCSLF